MKTRGNLSLLCFVALTGVLILHWSSWNIAQPLSIYQHSLKSVSVEKEFSWEELEPSKELKWKNCYTRRQCARLIVPLNHSEPNGEEAVIALIRKPALVPSTSRFYRGPVLFNPGGPGGSGVDLIQGVNGDLLSLIIGPRFDAVGFDPRGIARSTPRASFFKTDVERALWSAGVKIVNNSDEGIARTWARGHVQGQLAAETDSGYLRHINTDQTARDMLRIVEAHGRSKIQYWGFSYGSVLGATFAAMFPDKIERLIIDGVVDSENYYATLWSNNLLDTDKTMDSFFTGCAEAGPHVCLFWAPTAEDIRQNMTTLYDHIRSHPQPFKTDEKYGLLDYNLLRVAVFSSLYSPYATFRSLAKSLAELAAGDGTMIFNNFTPLPYQCSCDPTERLFASVPDASSTILCNDGDDVPGDLKSSEEYFDMLSKASNWGEIWASIRLGCVGWPKFPKDHFQGPFNASTSHPILLVGNTADPVTPLWAAKKMSTGFKDSVVLTQNSPGHCSISAPSLCTQKYIRKYLVDGTLPEPGTVCEPLGKPFFPIGKRDADNKLNKQDQHQDQERFTAMTEEDLEIFDAISELSQNSVVPGPFLTGLQFQNVLKGGQKCQ